MFLKHESESFFSIGRMTLTAKLAIPNATYYSEELNNFFGTQVELMQSDTVQNRVNLRMRAQVPPLHPVPVTVKVSVSPKASIFNLRAEGGDYITFMLIWTRRWRNM